MMLLRRLSCPANESPPLDCGVSRRSLEAARDRREGVDRFARHRRRRTGPLAGHDAGRRADDDDAVQLHCRRPKLEVDLIGHPEHDINAVANLLLGANSPDDHPIGAADAHPSNDVVPICTRLRRVLRAGFDVRGDHLRAGGGSAFRGDDALQGSRGYALGRERSRAKHEHRRENTGAEHAFHFSLLQWGATPLSPLRREAWWREWRHQCGWVLRSEMGEQATNSSLIGRLATMAPRAEPGQAMHD